jgi:glycosyltransferase involved in cell wall biosynthesis
MEFKEDPKFSVIIPVYDVPQDVFKKCLMSIADQDYPNLEVVIVANGGDKAAYSYAQAFAEGKPNWKVIFTEEKGACQARNRGFKESTGEIVSFTNSDYILKVGIIRAWVDALLANPDCGFAYGQYEYSSIQRDVYPSKPFDVYQLETHNYIDCGFPLWRKYVVEWDPEVKSLQDWDFWLRVVKSGVKGHYLGREISFIAAPPRMNGLSHDSTDHWAERVKFVKEKNGLPHRDICVASIGAPNHGIEIAKMIGADFRDDTFHKPLPQDYKALYLIGWYMHPNEQSNGHSMIMNRFLKSKRIVHFVGADIYWLRKFPVQKIREWAGAMKVACTSILCENEAAQAELASYGVQAEIVPIPPYSDFKVEPLPKDFTVALYLTKASDFDKYLVNHTLNVVKAMPDVKFIGYGDAELGQFTSKNFEHRGKIPRTEWEKLVYECSAYLRLVRHDTRPMASDEFIMAGRSVITNIKAPYVDYINTSGTLPFDAWDAYAPGFSAFRWPDTKAEIVRKIREVRKRQENMAAEYVSQRIVAAFELRTLLDKDKYRETIKRLSQPDAVKLEVVHA